MRKKLSLSTLAILICFSILIFPAIAKGEILAGIQLGYGSLDYSKAVGQKLESQTEWSTKFWSTYSHEDLLFTALYQGAHPLKGEKLTRNLAQVGANYLFLKEEPLLVYGGLGYQYISNGIDHKAITGDQITLAGHGFVGQAVVSIPVSEQITTTATITGSPWLKWTFGQSGSTHSLDRSAPSYVYQLDLSYKFAQDLGAHLGLLGGNFRVPSYDGKGETRGHYTGINLGVAWQF